MNQTFFSDLFIAIHVPTARLCIVKSSLFGSRVMFKENEVYLTSEIGPISDFELIEPYEVNE